jgi:hypothetical protein
LVLVAIRQRESGEWWEYDAMEQLCATHGVKLVTRYRELEGLCVKQIWSQVWSWEGKEGVVVQLGDNLVCKVKSEWWMRREAKQCRRWSWAGDAKDEGKAKAEWRRQKKMDNMECRQQRVVLRGWGCRVSPVKALEHLGADKVEAMYRRSDGRQGTVVLGFKDEDAAKAVRGRQEACGMAIWAEQAYNGRSRSDKERLVRTWWKHAGNDGEKTGNESEDEYGSEHAYDVWESGSEIENE